MAKYEVLKSELNKALSPEQKAAYKQHRQAHKYGIHDSLGGVRSDDFAELLSLNAKQRIEIDAIVDEIEKSLMAGKSKRESKIQEITDSHRRRAIELLSNSQKMKYESRFGKPVKK